MVKINFNEKCFLPLTTEKLIEGRAYTEVNFPNTVYICNPYGEIQAFSICGRSIILKEDIRKFIEVDLDIQVNKKQ